MRLFIAVNIPSPVIAKIEDIRCGLQQSDADVRWVENDDLHLTLKFIGDAGEDKVPLIAAELEPKLKGFGSFEIALSGTGAFPAMDFPRVLWLGITDASGKLKELAETIETAMLNLSFEKEHREFAPHLTLGRVRSRDNIGKLTDRVTQNCKYEPVSFKVTSVDVMESVLTPQGPKYKCLNSISV